MTANSAWTTTTILDATAKIMDYRGRTPKKLGMEWGDGYIPAISARNVRMGKIDFNEEFYVASDSLYRRWMTQGDMERGDTLITTEAPLGNVATVPDARRYVLSQRTVLLRPHPHLFDKTFFAQVLQSPEFQSLLTQNSSGSTALGIQRKKLEQLHIPMPPLKEQRRIAAGLRDADDLIATLERLITKKQAIKQGMMQQLLTGRTRLPGFNGSWGSVPFEALARPSKERVDPQTMPNGTQLIELEHIESGSGHIGRASTAAEAVSFKSVYRPGDVLFGKLRPYLRKFALVETHGLCSTEIWVLRAEKPNESAFVRYVVESDSFIGAASGGYGTHMPRADWNVVRRFPIPLPEPSEQKAIAGVLLDADQEIRVLIRRLAKARSLKSGMMQQLLTGRVRLPVEVES